MKVLFYTATPFLDIAIEMINILKNYVELHVLIEVSPKTVASADIDKLPENQIMINVSELISKASYKHLKPYFDGCASVNFVVNSSEHGFGFSSINVFFNTWNYVRKIQPDIIHLEAITIRSLGLFPFVFSRKKIYLTIHDAITHSGEDNWKMWLPRMVYLKTPYAKNYFFYSEFSKQQFEQYYKSDKNRKFIIRMHPYSIYKKYAKESQDRKYIIFFGNITQYKGLNVLLQAMPAVFSEFPDEVLLIAGRLNESFNLNKEIIEKFKNIRLLDRYIPIGELVNLIQEAKFVVCPYLDASQSGVLMTAFALDKPVVASNIGAFSEYIEDNITGFLVPPNDPNKLAEAIIKALNNKYYIDLEENIKKKSVIDLWSLNINILQKAYSSNFI